MKNKENNWASLREALFYVYKHHLNDFDWILKTNDNTYMVMENLRWLLYQYESDWPLIVGQRYFPEVSMHSNFFEQILIFKYKNRII